MIKERYVSLAVARLLNEKGFLQGIDLRMTRHLAFYDNAGLRFDVDKWYDAMVIDKIPFVVAPTQQMACDWLIETHNLFIDVGFGNDVKGEFLYMADIYDISNSAVYGKYEPIIYADDYLKNNPKTVGDAIDAALKYALEYLI